jgi:hypothetical protein
MSFCLSRTACIFFMVLTLMCSSMYVAAKFTLPASFWHLATDVQSKATVLPPQRKVELNAAIYAPPVIAGLALLALLSGVVWASACS